MARRTGKDSFFRFLAGGARKKRRAHGARQSRASAAAKRVSARRRQVRRAHTRVSVPGFSSRFLAWLRHHSASLGDGLYRLGSQPVPTLLNCLGIGIALALPLLLYLGLDNLQRLSHDWDQGGGISVFLRSDIDADAGERLAERVRSWRGVGAVRYQGRSESLAEFRSWSGLGDVLDGLRENPLPPMLIVLAADVAPEANVLERLRLELDALPEADSARADLEWVRRLHEFTVLAQRMVFALAALLGFGALLAVVNNTRLMIVGRREEIVVVKLVGGTVAYVRRPFLYCGLLYGLGGAAMAWLLSTAGIAWLKQPVQNLADLYGSDFVIEGLSWRYVLLLFGGMALLGLSGAWLAVVRYIESIEIDFDH